MRYLPFAFAMLVGISAFLPAAQDDLPEGKGRDALLKMCTTCHGVDRVTTERNSRRQWIDLVEDMMGRGADGSEAEAGAVVGYLTRNFGKQVNINTASAKEIASDLAFTPVESENIVQYRTRNGAFKTFEDVAKVPGLNADSLDEEKKNIVF